MPDDVAAHHPAMPAAAERMPLREYELSDADFRHIRRLVRQRLGIALADSKRELVYGRLSRRLRALQLSTFRSYLQRVEADVAGELQHFCNAITTHLTAFFREPHHFEFLAQQLLPTLAHANGAARRLRFWCAGCSSGEEPYSIAMVLLENQRHLRDWDIRILATDIDTDVLRQARAGHYSREQLAKLAPQRLRRWFQPAPDARHFMVREQLKQLVRFRTLNLVDQWPMRGPIDVIFCRNVMIYFDRETQRQIVARMAALQRPGDHLILGHSESLLQVSQQYQLLRDTIHRRLAP
jgi:chemotaxis protein methyltransferase CheR